MPTITDFSTVEFCEVFDMHLERPSAIISGASAQGNFEPFKFFIDENTDIDDVVFVARNHLGIAKDDIGFLTAGFSVKHRSGDDKISDIYGPKQKEGQAHRFARKEMMQVTIWPAGWDEFQKARYANMFEGPKGFDSSKDRLYPESKPITEGNEVAGSEVLKIEDEEAQKEPEVDTGTSKDGAPNQEVFSEE